MHPLQQQFQAHMQGLVHKVKTLRPNSQLCCRRDKKGGTANVQEACEGMPQCWPGPMAVTTTKLSQADKQYFADQEKAAVSSNKTPLYKRQTIPGFAKARNLLGWNGCGCRGGWVCNSSQECC
jgi:hypothetical protein